MTAKPSGSTAIKLETYARARASGMKNVEAYKTVPGVSPDAKPGTLANMASRYEKLTRARIAELTLARFNIAPPHDLQSAAMSRDEILAGLAKIARASEDDVKPNDRRQAFMDIARMEGHIIERVEHGRPGDFSKMSEPELDAEIERLAAMVRLGDRTLLTDGDGG